MSVAGKLKSQSDLAPAADMSPLTLSYFHELKNYPGGLVPGYVYKTLDNKNYYISAFIKTEENFNPEVLKELGIITGTHAGAIYSVHIPLNKLKDFVYKPGIGYLELDEPVFPTMDSAKRHAHVDSVHRGLGLSMAYDGKNVLVGIVDQGFDYDHPQFKDTLGKHYRILRVWEENTIAGSTYAGGTYGTEYRNISDILAHGSDSKDHTHGTHVAGIAAGSGVGGDTTGRLWRGMAHGSDILIVGIGPSENAWLSTGLTNMLDGINYCFNIAESMGLPVVVNLSWGSPTGPHDGTSLFSQACDAITGKRKIFVCSAGNNGDNAIHLAKTFTATDTALNTFVTFSQYLPFKKNRVDAWGEVGQSFKASIALHDGTKNIASTKVYSLDGNLHADTLIGKNNDTCFVKITTKIEKFNNEPRVLVELYNKTNESVLFTVKGTPGTVNMWQGYVYNSSGYYGVFSNGGKAWAQSGDNKITISDLSTTKSALCIGAYNSKVRYKSYKGVVTDYSQYFTVGQRADFSSRGPSVDKRIKPDITGPGSFLASGISSYDPSYKVGGSNYTSVVKMYVDPLTNDTNYYGMAQGTSMSSPAVAGIVALMLQVNPDLTPDMVRNIFDRTAIEDKFTQNLPDEGNNNWGQGKVNAMAAIELTKLMYDPKNAGTLKVFPNPVAGNQLNIFYQGTKNERVTFRLCDATGRVVYEGENRLHFGENWLTIDLHNICTGNTLYFLNWKTEGSSGVERVVTE